MQIDADGNVNVSRLAAKPHVTAGCGGFVDITARAKKIVFSGCFTAGAKLHVEDGRLHVAAEGKVKKFVPEVEHVSFSGGGRSPKAGRDLRHRALRDAAGAGRHHRHRGGSGRRPGARRAGPGRDPLLVADDLRTMDAALFRPEPLGLRLEEAEHG